MVALGYYIVYNYVCSFVFIARKRINMQ